MIHRRTLVGTAAAAAVPSLSRAASTVPAPIRTEWHDPTRNRTVPVLVRLPGGSGLASVVLVSHGLGGSREGLAYLGEALAAAGFIAVHLQHPGTDTSIWQGAPDPRLGMLAAVMDPTRALDRLQDVAFALDQLPRRPELAGHADPARTAIAGHSYGAWTVLHMLGEALPAGQYGLVLPDPRLRAGVALSPVPPMGLPPALAYAPVRAPVLSVTGTADRGWGVADWQERTLAFRDSKGPGVLAVLDGATHAAFAGEAVAGAHWNDPTYQGRTARLSVLFLQAVLGGDAAARQALLEGGFLARGDRIEARGLA